MPRQLLSLFLLLTFSQWAWADLVVVTAARNGVEKLSRQEVVYLFLGRTHHFSGGLPAVPLDLAVDAPERADFYRQLVNKEAAEIRAYWSRLVFSGGSRPPLVAENREEQLHLLTSLPGAVAYMERSKVDARLRIVYDLTAGN